MRLLKKIDPLILIVIGSLLLAGIIPARGAAGEMLDVVNAVAIAVLFFLYGARLSAAETIAGLKNWRLHGVILLITFALYPLVSLLLQPLEALLGSGLFAGVVYLCLVPSTVNSSIVFTSIAGGNVPGAIVAASASNIAGVLLTPLLVLLLLDPTESGEVGLGTLRDIALQLLVPFVLGQLVHRWLGNFASSKHVKQYDRLVIGLVVYTALSRGIDQGIFGIVGVWELVGILALTVVMVVGMLFVTLWLGRLLRFDRGDRIAIQFCGTKKSLASGLPIASVMFPAASVGLLVLPLIVYHQVQLIICSWLASRYGREQEQPAEG